MDNNNTAASTSASAEDQPRKRLASDRFEEPSDDEVERPAAAGRTGRRKIKIEYIQDKPRRQITFSKRKSGIMKKAYELSTLTGTQVLLLLASETGHVYTFATPKLQPMITTEDGKNLIQACLTNTAVEPVPPQMVPNPYYPYDPTYMHAALGGNGWDDPRHKMMVSQQQPELIPVHSGADLVTPPQSLAPSPAPHAE